MDLVEMIDEEMYSRVSKLTPLEEEKMLLGLNQKIEDKVVDISLVI